MKAFREVVVPKGLSQPTGVWSTAVATANGRMLFISGITSRLPDGKVAGVGDIAIQTRQVCNNLSIVLAAVGGTLADVASVTVYVTDITGFDRIHAVRREFFPVDPPASAMVEVTRLVDPQCLIEISAVAVLSEKSSRT